MKMRCKLWLFYYLLDNNLFSKAKRFLDGATVLILLRKTGEQGNMVEYFVDYKVGHQEGIILLYFHRLWSNYL